MNGLLRRSASLVLTLFATDSRPHVAPAERTQAPPLSELEPNDSALRADWLGAVQLGSSLAVAGHVGMLGRDLRDGFAVTAAAPCTLRFALRPVLPGVDLDLAVFAPSLDAFAASFDSRGALETGEIEIGEAGTAVHFVVASAWGSSSYVLEIEALPCPAAQQPSRPARPARVPEVLEGYRSSASAAAEP